jgi:hypothetical protein
MKTRTLRILGVGLTAGLVFGLIGSLFAAPVSADLMEWGIVNTPSWKDHVIEPGSDIFDWDVAGSDGEIVYATGHIGGGRSDWPDPPWDCEPGGDYTGLSGSFDFDDGQVSLDPISATDAEINATLYGDTCYLRGYFTAAIDVLIPGIADGTAYVTGEITDSDTAGADVLTFSGMLYGTITATDPVSTDLIGPATVCVRNFIIQSLTSGVVEITGGICTMPRVWKSEDGGVTWDDITAKVQDAANLPGPFARMGYGGVAIAPDDEEWLAIAGEMWDPNTDTMVPAVVASKDGGSNFSYTGDVVDAGESTRMHRIYDIDVSPEVDDIHNIALAGVASPDPLVGFPGSLFGSIFRLKAGTWLTASWEDTTAYDGWDDGVDPSHFFSRGVVACEFSPNFDIDDTIVCISVALSLAWFGPTGGIPYLQSGIWESGGVYNGEAGFPDAAQIKSDGDELLTGVYLRSCGLSLPADYDGSDPGARSLFIYVDSYDDTTDLVGGFMFRVDNSSLSPALGPPGDPLLASIDIYGDADTGKMVIGEYVKWDNGAPEGGDPIEADCCAGVRVWHTEEIDICCVQWEEACKDPSGPYMALVGYAADGEKIYATTSSTTDDFVEPLGVSDESAFSVSRDDGVSFNQLGLIDTDIDFLADVAVCPDCGVIYLSSINIREQLCSEEPCQAIYESCNCDSVWRSYDDGDTWERVFHGCWHEGDHQGWPLLRLPCDAIEDCCDRDPVSPSGTVYLGLYGMDQVFYSRDCGQCWNDPPATKIDIQDFAVESENIVYVIDEDGMFSMSTQYGRRWSDAVDTGLDSGHTIAACCEEGLIVVGGYGDDAVAWSDDGGDNWSTTDDLSGDSSQRVHVACDPVCENIVYAALCSAPEKGGIYRTDLTDGSWTDLNAEAFPYYGIVVAREGTLYAASYAIGVDESKDLCDKGRFTTSGVDKYYSGVARNLDPCETACCGTEDWDYLICGLNGNASWTSSDKENFNAEPAALKLCGCLSIDTNTVLWAIDEDYYDVTDGSDGALWSYEDCAAKMGPTLTSPADGSVLDCEPCAGCDAANFTLEWERMCEACSYDVQIMDEDGNLIVEWVDEDITGDPPTLFVDGTIENDEVMEYFLDCGVTYTWHVREANTSCECVHSPWSETWTFTVAPGAADAIQLLAPEKGAMGTPIQNVGFSWTSVRNATSYSFVLSPNANLTGALVSQDMSTTAFNYVGPLDYSKAYYWQIIAWQDGTRLTTSSIGVFNTMAELVAPTPPVVIEQQPAPVINIPPAEKITPTWIYAIIGIGAALAVVVIVLIVRTRRP